MAEQVLATAFMHDDVSDQDRRKVLLVCSAGGHLSQLMELRPWWQHHDRQWVTFDLPDARSKLGDEYLIPAHHPTTRNARNAVRNWFLARKVLADYRPDVIVSTGAAVAFPFFLQARLLSIPTVYVEVYDRVDSRTLTGRLCHPIASRFCAQWPEQQALYPNSTLIGPLY